MWTSANYMSGLGLLNSVTSILAVLLLDEERYYIFPEALNITKIILMGKWALTAVHTVLHIIALLHAITAIIHGKNTIPEISCDHSEWLRKYYLPLSLCISFSFHVYASIFFTKMTNK